MATDPYARSDTVFGAEAAARLAVMRATLAGSSFMDSMPLPPPPEVKRRSFWNKLFGSPSTPLQEPTETQIAATLRTWRASHQPACLRLERTLAQARKALAKTRAQVADLADSPAMSLHTTIPGGGGGFSENERPLPSAMTESPIMLLRRRERGLMILCEQLQGRLAVAQAQAEALSDKRARMHLLVEALGRCRCVYEDAQIVIHAPQPALQESFEAAVCARRAREGRLLHQWVDLFEKQLRKGADAAGEMYTPPPQVVLDFVVYLSRLVVAQHGLSGLLPQVSVCTARLLFPAVQAPLWNAASARNRTRDERMCAQQRWMRQLPPEQLGVESRFLEGGAGSAGRGGSGGGTGGGTGDGSGDGSGGGSGPGGAAGASTRGGPAPPPSAISVLSDFCFLSVPADMLLCVYRAVGHVHSAAAATAHVSPDQIGADSLLPLLVWTVVNTPLPHVFAALEYSKSLATREHQHSELGYYLATFEAACEYALDAQPPSRPHSPQGPEAVRAPDAADWIGDSGASSEVAPPSSPPPPLEYVREQTWASTPPPQSARAGFSSSLSMRTDKQALGALGSAPTAKLTPSKVLAKEVAEREALVDFLQQERAVDELVEALVL